ncbi:AMP-binding protein, partial [Lysobacter sp. 2RAB21]
MLQFASPSFDGSVFELTCALSSGATVCLGTRESLRPGAPLLEALNSYEITHVVLPSSALQACGDDAPVPTRVTLMLAGEALPPALAKRWAATHRVFNFYGPTETSVATSAHRCETRFEGSVPIGRPLSHCRVHLLDEHGRLAPIGVPGELCIGGSGVGLGYWRREELNEERFIADPFADSFAQQTGRNDVRLYRSGDMARWREDGVIEYLGRVDQQVKIRGHRVELGDIETHLRALDAIAEAAVALHRDPVGHLMLAAYVVPAASAQIDSESVRRVLSSRLPDYMVPSVYVELDALPLTPSGKLDRKALVPPARNRQSTYVAPRSEIERKLVALWQQIFGIEQIGIHDNFFELGGDSLSAAELIATFPKHFKSELSLGALFEGSTIASLAAYLERSGGENDPLGAVLSLRPTDEERPLFCIHPVTGFSWAYATMLRHLDQLPVYALQSRGLRGGGALPGSIEEIAADYIAQMRKIQPHGPYRLLGWSLGGLIGHAIAAQLQQTGERVELLAMMDSYPFVAEPVESSEAQQALAVLKFLGFHHRAKDNPPQDMRSLADLLCQEYEVFAIPLVQEIMKADAKLIENVAAVTRNNLMLARRYRPTPIDADVVFFNARLKDHV